MKILIVALCLLIFPHAHAWEQGAPLPLEQCAQHTPWGLALSSKSLTGICRQGYVSAYDSDAKIPQWVAYTLVSDAVLGCAQRITEFIGDNSVVSGAMPDDYTGTGYDRGHAAPAGDMNWSEQTRYEAALMTNIYPQAGSFNRGIWKSLETNVRGWVVQNRAAYTIYIGAIYTLNDKKIGRGVVVPTQFYKIVVNANTGEVAGWLFPHVAPYPNLGNNLTKYRTSVGNIMRVADVEFKFPANAVELPMTAEWPINFAALSAAKRQKCGL